MNPPSLSTLRRLQHARGYLGLGMLGAAATELEAILPADRGHPEVQLVRLALLMEEKRWEQLADAGGRLAQSHPEIEDAWIGWAYALRELNRVVEARAVLIDAESFHGRTSAVLHYNLACYECLLGSMPSARARLARACRMDKRFAAEGRKDPDLKTMHDDQAWVV